MNSAEASLRSSSLTKVATSRLSSLELVSILSLLDGPIDPDARSGLHHLLEWYLNDLKDRAVPKLTGGVDLEMIQFLLEE